jgi:hypothetical protein
MTNMTGSKLSIFSHPGKILGYWITTRSFPYRGIYYILPTSRKVTPILAWDEVEAHIGPGQYGHRYGNDLVVIQLPVIFPGCENMEMSLCNIQRNCQTRRGYKVLNWPHILNKNDARHKMTTIWYYTCYINMFSKILAPANMGIDMEMIL